MNTSRPRCFVMMPFSGTTPDHTEDYWSEFFESFVRTTMEELGVDCRRSTASPHMITAAIIKELFECELAVAVLTDNNPNVYYELGARHSLAHGTVMIIEKGQTIPSDLKPYGVVLYERNKRREFKRKMREALEQLSRRVLHDGPIRQFLSSSDGLLLHATSNQNTSAFGLKKILTSSRHSCVFVGQNLYSFTRREEDKQAIFTALVKNTELHVTLYLADHTSPAHTEALSCIIDEEMGPQWPSVLESFAGWLKSWRTAYPQDAERLRIRYSKRIGNVSATLSDHESENGRILIRPTLYHSNPQGRPCFIINRFESPAIYDGLTASFRQIFDHSSPLQ